MSTTAAINAPVYEAIDPDELERVRLKHAWIIESLYRASDTVKNMPL